ncbi:DNA phosphorothioation-dependent restriction protein DptG [Acinetobacter baumannii]|nr:DNA phosphorothioation-dependent restriction protein DptG [Acinetobacter baumannii]
MSLNLDLKVDTRTSMASFYPVRTQENSDDFNWSIISGLFLSNLYGLNFTEKKSSEIRDQLESFENICEDEFNVLLSSDDACSFIKQIYFNGKNIAKVSPKLSIYSLADTVDNSAVEKRIVSLMKTLFSKDKIYDDNMPNLNFIENKINEVFNTYFPTKKPNTADVISYLPKISNIFSKDLDFLTTKSKYFLENIQLFLELYMFIYTTQLSLSVNGWKEVKEPSVKECYFILDSEKASRERVCLQRGYKQVEKSLESIFPILALTESLQTNLEKKIPLWALVQQLTEEHFEPLKQYCYDFAADRELPLSLEEFKDCIDIMSELQYLFKEQFAKGQTRASAGNKVVNTIKYKVLKPFTQTRGSAGTIFVLNQEYLLLLTNIAIGEREKLRLYEIIDEFKQRGVFFDKESQKALVEFYERLGNVEKMSDSGDAIYVKKTI